MSEEERAEREKGEERPKDRESEVLSAGWSIGEVGLTGHDGVSG